jgi:hypothetical protein
VTVADWAFSSSVAIAALFYGYWRGYREGREDATKAAEERHDMELEKVADWLLQGGVR